MFHNKLHNPSLHHTHSKVMVGTTLGLAMGLAILNVLLSAQTTHYGIELTVSEQKALQLEQANAQTITNLASSAALTDLVQQAQAMGFTNKISYLTLPSNRVVALKK